MRKFLTLVGLLFSMNLLATDYLEGQHYFLMKNPIPAADKSKIEVVELFSYHCPHCYHFEPLLEAWNKKQGEEVVFKQMPAYWNSQMEPWVRGYFMALALGIKDKTHIAAFEVFQKEKRYLNSAKDWADFYARFGVDKDKALKVYDSFGVNQQFIQAKTRIQNNYKAEGTPEIYVQGKYRVALTAEVPTQEDMLKVVDFLVAEERKHLPK